MIKQNRILIIGGLGFIGKNLYLKLKNPSNLVHILSNVPLDNSDPFNEYVNGDDIIIGDISDISTISDLIQDYNVFFCLAGISGAAESFKDPSMDIQTNLLGHLNILNACKEQNRSAQLIFPSSRLVYGKPEFLPVNERHPLNPESIYAIHKLTAEYYYQLYNKAYNLNTVVFRISNPYGPFQLFGHKKYGLLNWFIYKAFNNELIEIFGTGDQKRDYLFIEDLIELFIKSIGHSTVTGKVYNIGFGKGISIVDMVKMIHEIVPETRYIYKDWPKIYKLIETGDYVSDLKRIKHDTGWYPKTSFRDGVIKTIEFYKNHHE